MEYKSFMAEGYSIGAYAESLYSRGYKHAGSLGQGNKQVHIFTPARGKVTHHMLLKHDGADPVRHEGAPDLKKIKGMTEMVETTDVIGIQKAQEKAAERQDKNVQEEDNHLEEGWFTRSHPRIGNRSGSTHRVTVQHTKTGHKSTFDVTAPTNEHAVKHVINHLKTHPSVLKVTQIKHLYEEKENLSEAGYAHAAALDKHITDAEQEYGKNGLSKLYHHHMNNAYGRADRLNGMDWAANPELKDRYKTQVSKWLNMNSKYVRFSESLDEMSIKGAASRVHAALQHGAAMTHAAGMSGPEQLSATPGGMAAPAAYGAAHAIDHLSGGRISGAVKKVFRREETMEEGAVEDALAKQRASIEAHAERIRQTKLDNTKNITGPTKRILARVEKNHVWQPKTPDKPFRKKNVVTLIKNAQQKSKDGADKPMMIKSMKEWMELQEVSKSTLKSYVKKAEKSMDDTYKNEKSPKKWDQVTWKRAVGLVRAEKRLEKNESIIPAIAAASGSIALRNMRSGSARAPAKREKNTPPGAMKKIKRWWGGHETAADKHDAAIEDFHKTNNPNKQAARLKAASNFKKAHDGKGAPRFGTRKEDLDEALEIRHAINHLDRQARHHARKYKEHQREMNSIANNPEHSHEQALKYSGHAEEAIWHHRQYKARLAQLDAGKNEDLIDEAQDKKKGVTVAIPVDIDGKKYSAVNGQAYVHARQTVGNGRWNTSKRTMRRPLKPGPVHDKVITALEKHKADRDAELEQWYKDNPHAQRHHIGEGLVSKITNAAKNINKRLKPAAVRIAQTREKVGYDNAKGKDLSPRGNALRKVEKIEWAKANPKKKPKDIVPMGKLPDKVWNEEQSLDEGRRRYGHNKSDEERDQEDRVDHNDSRRKAVTSWSVKTPDEKGKAVKHAATVEKLRATLAAKKRAATAAVRASNKIAREKAKQDAEYQKKDAIGKAADDMKNRPFGKPSPHAAPASTPAPAGPDNRSEFRKRFDTVKHHIATRPFGGKSYAAEEVVDEGMFRKLAHSVAGKSIAKSRARASFRAADADEGAGEHKEKAGYAYQDIARGKGLKFGSRKEELEIRPGQKVLKEKPKRGPDGKLSKSKAAQRVEDCIKMSGKKQKIDTEPSYNPLTTAGGGGGTPNA